MTTLNICRNQQDKSYRYKMPQLLVKVEGRGNGIKTILLNIFDVSKALHCDPAYPIKYFSLELGTQSKYDTKRKVGIINGSHSSQVFSKLLETFIDIFILCSVCKLPELNMKVKKESIFVDCRACGHNGKLRTEHKLTTYIVHNPPKHKSSNVSNETFVLNDSVIEDTEIEWFTDTSPEAVERRRIEEFGDK